MTDILVVKTTTDRQDHAEHLARLLVSERLAACVQIVGPIQSVYRWQGTVTSAAEWQLWIKTRQTCWEQLRQKIIAKHHYETPEILALPVAAGADGFVQWINAETRSAERGASP